MTNKDPKEVAARWNTNLKASGAAIRAGVNAMTEAPGKKAAAAQEKMLANIVAAIEDGTWARNVAGVSLEEWRKAMEIGIGRIPAGADAAKPEVENFMREFLPHVEAGAERVRAMPNVTLEDGIARAAEMIRHNAQFKRKK